MFTEGFAGGICYHLANITGKGVRSTNTGLVTIQANGQRQSDGVTDITLAHEFGHNFGSEVRNHNPGHKSWPCLQFLSIATPPPPTPFYVESPQGLLSYVDAPPTPTQNGKRREIIFYTF